MENSVNASIALPPSPSPPDEPGINGAWYGNIQYLLNISAVGAFCCVALFLFVKLRSDHRMPSPSGLFAKLLAVWHTTSQQIARHCGANAAQFLYIEGGSFVMLLVIAVFALGLILPLNLYGGTVLMDDQFSKTTINHIAKGSSLLWVHVFYMILVVCVVHFGILTLEDRLSTTRFHDGTPTVNSVSVFTVMIEGIPRGLAVDRRPLEDYFLHKYPGKVYKVIVPLNLCSLDDMMAELVKVRNDISWLQARLDSAAAFERREYSLGDDHGEDGAEFSPSEVLHWHDNDNSARCKQLYEQFMLNMRELWKWAVVTLGLTDEQKLQRLQEAERKLGVEIALFKEGRAEGAGIAFVIFKDIYSTNKAIQDLRMEKKRPIGRFVPVMELQLGRSRWKVERAPPASDIYWNHMGMSKISLKIRRVAVNTCLLLLLLFCSSPLAIISAVKSAGRIIDAEAMDNAQRWLDWVQATSWAAAVVLQFLPNVLIFVSMYIVIPSALCSLSKFERHLTVSGEQRASLLKMVCFFLVNLILLRALLESSLESTLLRMGRCYLDGEDCKRIEQYMSASFLSRSCLSSLAFLITSTFLGISYDLLAPIPWIKRKLQKFKKNDMLQLVPEQNENDLSESPEDILRRPLISERENGLYSISNGHGLNGIDLQGQDLCVYPISRNLHVPEQAFDFAQYYAFNLTIFALTMIYSSFAPLVVPVGAFYFGYRYIVDKYNFLFIYRVRGFPAGNDGKLMDSVLCIMRLCVVLFLLSMLLFFSVRGDSARLQAVFTCGILLLYKLVPSRNDGFQPFLLDGMQTVDTVVDGPTDYEVFSQPSYDWDAYNI
ncbi:CSC1-like protein At4g35870 [Nymphaea colorata]|nr:CSC1-like protein At4g35870 [Nymphaea colorata]